MTERVLSRSPTPTDPSDFRSRLGPTMRTMNDTTDTSMTHSQRSSSHMSARRTLRSERRRGGTLVEFALIALLCYVLLAGILTFGQLLYSGQVLQAAADMAARETSRLALPPETTLDDLLADPTSRFSQEVFSEQFLVVDVTDWADGTVAVGTTLPEYLQALGMPLVNRALVPLMFVERVTSGPFSGRRFLRYPGAVVQDTSGVTPFLTVQVPQVLGPAATLAAPGPEQISWSRVLEEVPGAGGASQFPLSSPERGVVALRLNFPYQSASMTAQWGLTARQVAADPGIERGWARGNVGNVIESDNAGVVVIGGGTPLPAARAPVDLSGGEAGTYAGPQGLGTLLAFAKEVRPFRRVLTSQSTYRREVFE
jgi:hypothetical protein